MAHHHLFAVAPCHIGRPAQRRQGTDWLQAGHRWRYRLADYRLICRLQDEVLVILVIELGNRQGIRR
jgi:mRNA-degrading endonuclease RelE of RelBE toxin-antitoxin system